jgi:hypothetical protein
VCQPLAPIPGKLCGLFIETERLWIEFCIKREGAPDRIATLPYAALDLPSIRVPIFSLGKWRNCVRSSGADCAVASDRGLPELQFLPKFSGSFVSRTM